MKSQLVLAKKGKLNHKSDFICSLNDDSYWISNSVFLLYTLKDEKLKTSPNKPKQQKESK